MRRVRFRDSAGSVRDGDWTESGIEAAGRVYDPDGVTILPPVSPSKIICIGLNYADHAEEEGMEIPDRPMLFWKGPNAVAAHDDTVMLPQGKDRVDYEAEIAVVIGEQARNVPADEAMSVVEGFTCMNDISNRDDQRIEQNWIRGKAFDGAAPLGPVVASPDQVPEDASVELRLNGDVRQESTRAEFIFSIPELIEEITRYMTLEPGDVISTGTTAGVGPLSDGDVVEVEVEGVGVLEHDVQVE
jgi:2-keto-4-pentenoate hydratase/2-oxohepta-3-ene-1,7-dioic acid hydratase in catechol pathway